MLSYVILEDFALKTSRNGKKAGTRKRDMPDAQQKGA